jgi:DNA-binding CsgD family transcriptional regulator
VDPLRATDAINGHNGQPPRTIGCLSRRELEVLERMAQGQTNAQVAAGLQISVHAVKFHLASVFRKLEVRNRTEAASVYLRASPDMLH